MVKFLKSPFLLILILISALLYGHLMPYKVQSLFYALSLTIKEVLLFIIPFVVFTLIFNSTNHLPKGALGIIILLMTLIVLSNIVSSSISYLIATNVLNHNLLPSIKIPLSDTKITDSLKPMWVFKLPTILPTSYALVIGFIFGIISPRVSQGKSQQISKQLFKICFYILEKVFGPLIPIFIFGFALKMGSDDALKLLLNQYFMVFVLVTISSYTYILFLYMIGSAFNLKLCFTRLLNMSPALITAFSSMSSITAMPFSLSAAKKNANKDIADIVVPTTVNMHLIGDCFFIIILSITMLYSFEYDISFSNYFIFFIYFLLSKFAIASVPGGGILIMLPVLEQYLNFSPIMLSLITALYLVFDPVITSANVMGNGAFVVIFSKIYEKLFYNKQKC